MSNLDYIYVILLILISVVLETIVIRQLLSWAYRNQLFDTVGERKIHHDKIPRVGGLSFVPVMIFSMFVIALLSDVIGIYNAVTFQLLFSRNTIFGLFSVFLLYFVGLDDDLWGLGYRIKLLVQMICALMVIMTEKLYVHSLYGILGVYEIPPFIGVVISFFIILLIVNAINLIDGIDGLSAALGILSVMAYAAPLHYRGCTLLFYGCISSFGVLMTFAYYNLFGCLRKHKKTFMGDCGTLTLGMFLSLMVLRIIDTPTTHSGELNPMVLSFTPLLVPILDTMRVFIHRLRFHANPFLPDDNHIHHKLMKLGFDQRMALLIIMCISAVFVAFNLVCAFAKVNINIIVIADIVMYTVMNIGLTKRINSIKSIK